MIKAMSTPETIKIYAETLDPQLEAAQGMLKLLEESPDTKMGKSKEELQKEVAEKGTERTIWKGCGSF